MKVSYEKSFTYKILQRLKQLRSPIVLREDFVNLGSYRQVSRGLNALVMQGRLVKIGYGVYAKAYRSSYSDLLLIKGGGFDAISRKILDRLGIKWNPSAEEEAYNEGRTTQVPVRNVVRLKTRFRRKVAYMNKTLQFEGMVNAK